MLYGGENGATDLICICRANKSIKSFFNYCGETNNETICKNV